MHTSSSSTTFLFSTLLLLLAPWTTARPLCNPTSNSTTSNSRNSSSNAADQIVLTSSILDTAGGAPPNGPPPPHLSRQALDRFQAANFLENLEAQFFLDGAANLTGWGDADAIPGNTLEIVKKVAAQEQVHIATIEGVLTHFNEPTIPPCRYAFPVDTAASFLALAQVITTVGIGAVLDVATLDALTDPAVIQNVASIVTVEARHDAFFRTAGSANAHRVPNPAPFDTRISGVWALNLAIPFVVPGSCAIVPSFPRLPALTVTSLTPAHGFNATDGAVRFTAAPYDVDHGAKLSVGWVNQANVPVYTPATVAADGTIQTKVPPGLAGVAFAALTSQTEAADVDALTAKTLAGPAVVILS